MLTLIIRILIFLPLIYSAIFSNGYALQIEQPDSIFADTTNEKYGYVRFEVEPDTAYLYIDTNFDDPLLITNGTEIKLTVGFHRLLIFGKTIPDRRFRIEVKEDRFQNVIVNFPVRRLDDSYYSTYAALKWQANLMVFSDEDTFISISETEYRSQGFLKVKLPGGVYRIRFESISGSLRELFVEINTHQLTTVEEHLKPLKGNSIAGGVIPGISQLYKKQRIKALSIISIIGLSAGLAIHYNQRIGTGSNEFDRILTNYRQANSEQEVVELGNRLDRLSDEIKSLETKRNVALTSAILFYVVNIVDAFRPPEAGFANKNTFNPYRAFSFDIQKNYAVAKINLRF